MYHPTTLTDAFVLLQIFVVCNSLNLGPIFRDDESNQNDVFNHNRRGLEQNMLLPQTVGGPCMKMSGPCRLETSQDLNSMTFYNISCQCYPQKVPIELWTAVSVLILINLNHTVIHLPLLFMHPYAQN